MWFRVVLNKDGSIGKVSEVEACRSEGQYVRYVEAPSKSEACSQARSWWEREQERIIARRKQDEIDRQARWKAKEAQEAKFARRRAAIEHAAIAAATAVTKHADPRLDEYTLRNALRRFDQNPKTFRKWLLQQLDSIKAATAARQKAQLLPL